jgi:hypothetical protein
MLASLEFIGKQNWIRCLQGIPLTYSKVIKSIFQHSSSPSLLFDTMLAHLEFIDKQNWILKLYFPLCT